jgi:hypothetical protein
MLAVGLRNASNCCKILVASIDIALLLLLLRNGTLLFRWLYKLGLRGTLPFY